MTNLRMVSLLLQHLLQEVHRQLRRGCERRKEVRVQLQFRIFMTRADKMTIFSV